MAPDSVDPPGGHMPYTYLELFSPPDPAYKRTITLTWPSNIKWVHVQGKWGEGECAVNDLWIDADSPQPVRVYVGGCDGPIIDWCWDDENGVEQSAAWDAGISHEAFLAYDENGNPVYPDVENVIHLTDSRTVFHDGIEDVAGDMYVYNTAYGFCTPVSWLYDGEHKIDDGVLELLSGGLPVENADGSVSYVNPFTGQRFSGGALGGGRVSNPLKSADQQAGAGQVLPMYLTVYSSAPPEVYLGTSVSVAGHLLSMGDSSDHFYYYRLPKPEVGDTINIIIERERKLVFQQSYTYEPGAVKFVQLDRLNADEPVDSGRELQQAGRMVLRVNNYGGQPTVEWRTKDWLQAALTAFAWTPVSLADSDDEHGVYWYVFSKDDVGDEFMIRATAPGSDKALEQAVVFSERELTITLNKVPATVAGVTVPPAAGDMTVIAWASGALQTSVRPSSYFALDSWQALTPVSAEAQEHNGHSAVRYVYYIQPQRDWLGQTGEVVLRFTQSTTTKGREVTLRFTPDSVQEYDLDAMRAEEADVDLGSPIMPMLFLGGGALLMVGIVVLKVMKR